MQKYCWARSMDLGQANSWCQWRAVRAAQCTQHTLCTGYWLRYMVSHSEEANMLKYKSREHWTDRYEPEDGHQVGQELLQHNHRVDRSSVQVQHSVISSPYWVVLLSTKHDPHEMLKPQSCCTIITFTSECFKSTFSSLQQSTQPATNTSKPISYRKQLFKINIGFLYQWQQMYYYYYWQVIKKIFIASCSRASAWVALSVKHQLWNDICPGQHPGSQGFYFLGSHTSAQYGVEFKKVCVMCQG